MRAIFLTLLSVLLLSSGCSRGPRHAFTAWAKAVQNGDASAIARLDRELARNAAKLTEVEFDSFAADLAGHLKRPAATAFIETGFGVEPSLYQRKLYFPKGTRFSVRTEESRGPDNAQLSVEVNYQRTDAPVYVSDVQVVWHGPAGTTPGSDDQPARPTPVFSSGYFEATHPFLANPGYKGYELQTQSGAVRTMTLKVDLVRDPELGWTIDDLTPVVAANVYWD